MRFCAEEIAAFAAPQLRSLTLRWASAAAVAELPKCSRLEELSLSYTDSWEELCQSLTASLPSLTALQSLDVDLDEDNEHDPEELDGDAAAYEPWRLPPSLTSLHLHAVADCPAIKARNLRSITAPLSDSQLRDVLTENPSLTSVRFPLFEASVDFETESPVLLPETVAVLLRCSRLALLDISQMHAPGSFLRGVFTSTQLSGLTVLGVTLDRDADPGDVSSALQSSPVLRHCCLYWNHPAPGDAADVPERKAALSASGGGCSKLQCPALEHLHLDLADSSLCALAAPKLETLSLRSAGISSRVLADLRCPAVTTLWLDDLPWLDDKTLIRALEQLPQLRSLCLKRCPRVTVVAVAGLAFAAPQTLRQLGVVDCKGITAKDLDVDTVATVLHSLPRLRGLNLPLADAVGNSLKQTFAKLGLQCFLYNFATDGCVYRRLDDA